MGRDSDVRLLSTGWLPNEELPSDLSLIAGPNAMISAAAAGVLVLMTWIYGDAPAQPPTQWRLYTDTTNGFSFRYPPGLHIVEPSIEAAHVEGLTGLVELIPDSPGPRDTKMSVIRVLVTQCGPMVACFDETQLRQVCHRPRRLHIGNVDGLQCIDFGSAACHWGARILFANRQVNIQTWATDQAANEGATTREQCMDRIVPTNVPYRVLDILATFVFDEKNR